MPCLHAADFWVLHVYLTYNSRFRMPIRQMVIKNSQDSHVSVVNLMTQRVTTNPQTMITWLENLRVSGGGDCPEYALSGMLKGTCKQQTGKSLSLRPCTVYLYNHNIIHQRSTIMYSLHCRNRNIQQTFQHLPVYWCWRQRREVAEAGVGVSHGEISNPSLPSH
jgi:uncharacterized protein YehS (DUF1456 family)